MSALMGVARGIPIMIGLVGMARVFPVMSCLVGVSRVITVMNGLLEGVASVIPVGTKFGGS